MEVDIMTQFNQRYLDALNHPDASTRECSRRYVAQRLDELHGAVMEYREKINHPAIDDKTGAVMQEIIDEYDEVKRRLQSCL